MDSVIFTVKIRRCFGEIAIPTPIYSPASFTISERKNNTFFPFFTG